MYDLNRKSVLEELDNSVPYKGYTEIIPVSLRSHPEKASIIPLKFAEKKNKSSTLKSEMLSRAHV